MEKKKFSTIGLKVNPHSLRRGVLKDWPSEFAKNNNDMSEGKKEKHTKSE